MKPSPLLVFIFLLLTCAYVVSAQYETDIKVMIESQPQIARGGEHIKYTYSVRNDGPATAEGYLLGGSEQLIRYDSAKSSKGSCAIDQRGTWVLRCILGELAQNETATIEVSATVVDIDDLNTLCGNKEENIRNFLLRKDGGAQSKIAPLKEVTCRLSIVRVDASIKDTNDQNDRAYLNVKLLPSANKPPILKILSPKENEIFIKPAGQQVSRTISIEASDPDGKIIAVKVDCGIEKKDPYDDFELLIDGKRYGTLVSDSIRWLNPPIGKHTLQVVAWFAHTRDRELARSPLITVNVK
jgi:hypothetical protein